MLEITIDITNHASVIKMITVVVSKTIVGTREDVRFVSITVRMVDPDRATTLPVPCVVGRRGGIGEPKGPTHHASI